MLRLALLALGAVAFVVVFVVFLHVKPFGGVACLASFFLLLGEVVVVAAVVVCVFLHAKPFGGVACVAWPIPGLGVRCERVCVGERVGRSCRRRRLRFFARQALRRGGVQRLALLVLGAFAVVDAVVVCVFFCTPSPSVGWRASLGPSTGWASGVSVCVCGCECVCMC